MEQLYKNIENTTDLKMHKSEPESVEDAWERADQQYDMFSNMVHDAHKYSKKPLDESELISITAPNTDISKFIFNNKISKDAIAEIIRVSKLRNQDPYDVLAHLLIEGSGKYPITTNEYFNTHDVISSQINPKFTQYYSQDREKQLKQFGIWQEGKTFTANEIYKAAEKFNTAREEAFKQVVIPQSDIDAVAVRMMKKGRDFNPAQKGYESYNGKVKNSYLDMIDSAIESLKEHMPNLFKQNEK
jgi:hypothetical protein